MRRLLASLVLLASPIVADAQGCGPTRLKVSASVTLDAPPAKVWALIGNFQDTSWARNIRVSHGSGGNMPDIATRVVTARDGSTTQESLYKYDDAAKSYSYHVDAVDVAVLPVQNAAVTIEVVAIDGGAKSMVRWRAAFYRFIKLGETAPDSADLAATKAVDSLARETLEGLRARAEAKT